MIKRETNWQILTASRTHLSNGTDHQEIDSAKVREWQFYLNQERWRPTVIVNAAAYTNVDKCETDREQAWRTNVKLVESLTRAAASVDAKVIQISTDYIFDGTSGPYTEDATPNPVNYYGRTKLAAENVCHRSNVSCLIARTMWLYGVHSGGRSTFVEWLLNTLQSKKDVSVVTDEVGTATLTDDIAFAIIHAIEKKVTGTMNLSGPTIQSRWDMAVDIARIFGYDENIIGQTTTATLQRPARRPLQSGLISLKAEAALGFNFSSTVSGLTYLRTTMQRNEANQVE
jgi:dTDP-4-dehydrorhamnose reductase